MEYLYHPAGSLVRVADDEFLRRFRQDWVFHHPLEAEQIEFAGREAEVLGWAEYHGGAPLYTLRGIPGIWHEQCLVPVQNTLLCHSCGQLLRYTCRVSAITFRCPKCKAERMIDGTSIHGT